MRIPLARNAATQTADMYIFGVIGDDFFGEGITDAMVAEALGELDPDVNALNVHIDSPGGLVMQGHAIYNMLANLNQRGIHVTTIAEGWAASAASVILQAGDDRRVAENGLVMIHNAWGMTIGNNTDHLKQAEVLSKIDETIALTYAARSGKKTKAEFLRMMEMESWFTGKEAVAAGLADGVLKAKAPEDAAAMMMQAAAISLRGKVAARARYQHAPAETPEEIRELERYLRDDAGYSRSVAKTIASKLFDDDDSSAMLDRRQWDAGLVDDDDAEEVLKSLARSTEKLLAGVFSR